MSRTIVLVALLGLLVALALPAGAQVSQGTVTASVEPWVSVTSSNPSPVLIAANIMGTTETSAKEATGTSVDPGAFEINMNCYISYTLEAQQLWSTSHNEGHPLRNDQLKTEYVLTSYKDGALVPGSKNANPDKLSDPANSFDVPDRTADVKTDARDTYALLTTAGLAPWEGHNWTFKYGVKATNINNAEALPHADNYAAQIKLTITGSVLG
ncbi:MAG TPA: hypothetical protein VGM19_00800 [Armatimonadota bacterium]|jgi:hypothetical protein